LQRSGREEARWRAGEIFLIRRVAGGGRGIQRFKSQQERFPRNGGPKSRRWKGTSQDPQQDGDRPGREPSIMAACGCADDTRPMPKVGTDQALAKGGVASPETEQTAHLAEPRPRCRLDSDEPP
jgi:hypothetical protein